MCFLQAKLTGQGRRAVRQCCRRQQRALHSRPCAHMHAVVLCCSVAPVGMFMKNGIFSWSLPLQISERERVQARDHKEWQKRAQLAFLRATFSYITHIRSQRANSLQNSARVRRRSNHTQSKTERRKERPNAHASLRYFVSIYFIISQFLSKPRQQRSNSVRLEQSRSMRQRDRFDRRVARSTYRART